MKSQISAEMIILLVVLLAIVAIVASNLISSTKQTSETIKNKTAQISEKLNNACFTDSDCPSGKKCVSGECQ